VARDGDEGSIVSGVLTLSVVPFCPSRVGSQHFLAPSPRRWTCAQQLTFALMCSETATAMGVPTSMLTHAHRQHPTAVMLLLTAEM